MLQVHIQFFCCCCSFADVVAGASPSVPPRLAVASVAAGVAALAAAAADASAHIAARAAGITAVDLLRLLAPLLALRGMFKRVKHYWPQLNCGLPC